MQRNEILTHL